MESVQGVIRERSTATACHVPPNGDAGETKQSRWHKRRLFCPKPYGTAEGLKNWGGGGGVLKKNK